LSLLLPFGYHVFLVLKKDTQRYCSRSRPRLLFRTMCIFLLFHKTEIIHRHAVKKNNNNIIHYNYRYTLSRRLCSFIVYYNYHNILCHCASEYVFFSNLNKSYYICVHLSINCNNIAMTRHGACMLRTYYTYYTYIVYK